MTKIKHCPLSKFSGNEIYKSQWYEDYILAYVFKDVDKGFYIDVGTNNPNIASVTKYFYDLGWNGINFEPQEKYFEMLKQHRPRDININKAVGDSIGETIFVIPYKPEEGIASMDNSMINSLSKDDNKYYLAHNVKTTSLNATLEELNVKEIDFLKIDVEGAEDKVLRGIDLKKFRPKVIVLEAWLPLSGKDYYSYLKFEHILFDNDYLLAMDDELNRYYYRKESPELAAKFREIRKCVVLDKMRRDAFCQNENYCKL